MKNNEEMLKKFPTMKSIGGVKDENGVSSKPSEEVKAEPEKIDFSNVKIEPLFEEEDRKSTRLNSSHDRQSRMPSSA